MSEMPKIRLRYHIEKCHFGYQVSDSSEERPIAREMTHGDADRVSAAMNLLEAVERGEVKVVPNE